MKGLVRMRYCQSPSGSEVAPVSEVPLLAVKTVGKASQNVPPVTMTPGQKRLVMLVVIAATAGLYDLVVCQSKMASVPQTMPAVGLQAVVVVTLVHLAVRILHCVFVSVLSACYRSPRGQTRFVRVLHPYLVGRLALLSKLAQLSLYVSRRATEFV